MTDTVVSATGEVVQINDFTVDISQIQSPTLGKFLPAFIKAKTAFGPVLKDKNNPAFKSKYADLRAVLEAVDPSLLDEGITFMQPTVVNQYGVHILFSQLIHESGEWRGSIWKLTPIQANPQGEGSALTYARRQQAQTLLGIAPEDDDGKSASQPAKKESSGRNWLEDAQVIAGGDGTAEGRRKALLKLGEDCEKAQEMTPALRKEIISLGTKLRAEIEKAKQDALPQAGESKAAES